MSVPPEVLGLSQLRELLDDLPHPLWVADAAGDLLLANRAYEAAFGDAGAGLQRRPFPGTPDPSGAGPDGRHAREAIIALDGVETCWLVVQWPLRDAANGSGRAPMAGIATDITRQRQAQRQLHERQARPPAA